MSAEERIQQLAKLAEQLDHPDTSIAMAERNQFTRLVDGCIERGREHLPILFKIGATLFALLIFIYVRLLGITIRLLRAGDWQWPELPSPCILTLWHRSAPCLLAAIARQRPVIPMVIMVSPNPRGDTLAVMFRLLGVKVVRGESGHGGRYALIELSNELQSGKCALLTVDGGGPANFAKPGAVILSIASERPLLALGTDCRPAFAEPHKWDSPRNPLPFSRVAIAVSRKVTFPPIQDAAALECARKLLELELHSVSETASETLRKL